MLILTALACALSPANRAIVQTTFTAWSTISTRVLRLAPERPPRIVLFDRDCTFTLTPSPRGVLSIQGTRVAITGAPHGDSIALPNGQRIPVAGMVFTSLYSPHDSAFFVAALPDVWRADPKYRDDPEDWEAFLPPVMIHELTHTRQLAAMMRALEPAGKALHLDNLDDDMIQRRFQSDSAFTGAVQREIDLFYRAADESSAERRRSLIAAALAARAQRIATYFRGGDSAFATIETRFLDLEGVAQFAALSYIRDHPKRGETAAQAVARVRNNKKWWSQEYGLALYLATNAVARDWQREVFPPTLRSAFDVIGRVSAVRDRDARR